MAVEDLNPEGMVGNSNLAGGILDASWGRFLYYLEYRGENAGIEGGD